MLGIMRCARVKVLLAAACAVVGGGVLGCNLAMLLGFESPPASLPGWVAGGNDELLVFGRLQGSGAAYSRLLNGDQSAQAELSTKISVVAAADGALVQTVEVPIVPTSGVLNAVVSDGRWVVLTDVQGSRYAVDLQGDGTPRAVADAASIIGLDAGRLLLRPDDADTGTWPMSVLDLATGVQTDLPADCMMEGAIRGPWVALRCFQGSLRIDLIDLADGTGRTIASHPPSASMLTLIEGRVVWQQEPSQQDEPIALRAYDLQTGQTATIMELNSRDTRVQAIGPAGVATDAEFFNGITNRVRYELHGWDGSTTLLQEVETVYPEFRPVYGIRPPVIVGRRVVYSAAFRDEWLVYDSATGETTSLGHL